MADVVVVGAGPVGMLIAAELHRRDVDVAVLEQRPAAGAGSRAIGVHAPVLAALESSGVTERLLAGALRVPRGEARAGSHVLGTVRFDRLSTRFPFVATLPQAATEAAIGGHGPVPLRGTRVTAVRARGSEVEVHAEVAGAAIELTARIVIVASGSGGRGLVYRPGAVKVHEYRDRYLMSDVVVADGRTVGEGRPGMPGGAADGDSGGPPTAVVNLAADGVLESFPLPGGARRFVAWDDPTADPDPEARVLRMRVALERRGAAAAAASVREATGFGVRRVVAGRLRRGRVIVVGDAAHEVSPIGGQGMNLGLLDAAGLAPLVADWIRTGVVPDPALREWEHRRLASARTAARLAALNTRLGRPCGPASDLARRLLVRGMLAPPAGALFAHAYAMGLDRDA